MIETERLRLRPYTDADADRVLAILSHPEVYPWLGNPPQHPMPDLDAAHAWVARHHAREAADPLDLRRAVEVVETGVVAGTALIAQLERRDGGFVGEYEVGWHLHPDSSGHGYATEASAALLDHAFAHGLTEVWCGMFTENTASRRLAERLGLSFQGIRSDGWYGYEVEGPLFHATRGQWVAMRSQAPA